MDKILPRHYRGQKINNQHEGQILTCTFFVVSTLHWDSVERSERTDNTLKKRIEERTTSTFESIGVGEVKTITNPFPMLKFVFLILQDRIHYQFSILN